MQRMFSDHSGIKLDIYKNNKFVEFTNMGKLNNEILLK